MWEEYYSELDQLPDWLKEPVPFVAEALPLFREHGVQLLLDLGCGAGRNAVYLAARGLDVVGIDISKSALRKVKRWSKTRAITGVTVLCASMTSLPFANLTFRAIISVSVIHHAVKKDIEKAVLEVHRVLQAEGLLLANLLSTEDCRDGSGLRIEDETFQVLEDFDGKQFKETHHFFSQKEIQALLAHFKSVNIAPIQSGKGEDVHKYWKVTAEK